MMARSAGRGNQTGDFAASKWRGILRQKVASLGRMIVKSARAARKDAAGRSTIRRTRAVPSCLIALFLSGSKAMIRGTVGVVSVRTGQVRGSLLFP
jgi:hypothetical protein